MATMRGLFVIICCLFSIFAILQPVLAIPAEPELEVGRRDFNWVFIDALERY